MEMKALEDLFLEELGELYDAERQIVKALPKMAKAAGNSALRAAFETHLKQTERHADRLEKIFKAIEREPESHTSEPISQIIKQGDQLIASKSESAIRDAALISAAQKVEHYEITMYGSARSHAKMLGLAKVAASLEQTLGEEEQTDLLLSQLAQKSVNVEASRAPFALARTSPRGDEEETGWGFGGLLFGAIVGAAVALLYAPKAGESLRSDLRDAADQWRGTAENLIERGRKTIGEQREKISPQL